MQAVEIKRNPATRIGIAAVAVAVLAAITLGITLLLTVNEEKALIPMAAPSVNRFEQITLLEDNIARPVYAGSPARSLAEMQLMEENVEFQTQVSSRSYLDIQWIEDNAPLPVNTGTGSPMD